MVGVHYDIHFGMGDASSNGCAFYTIYGPTLEEVRAWGEKQAWDMIRDRRPTRYTLKKMQSGPVADRLLTESGTRPLDYEEVRRKSDARKFDDQRRFGLGSSGMVGCHQARDQPLAPEASAAPTLEKIRREMEPHIPPGTPQYEHVVAGANWDPAEHAYYIFTLLGETGGEWSEAVLCRAVNFYHAAGIWVWHELQHGDRVRRAGFQLANGFRTVGEPRLGRR